ncbi:LLM class flavin-dependent oxidoreductase [Cytobacillus purgationiresistens]|uniref:FMN-dependent oxidoreductase (Nitrilotriacetate monooxygenase family) n=1 Tax=Cytobacillus purgationiresistens TaxID=863449 RepID=A0ABU0AC47_9BACI|nr:LLM class flavin-dependent oxidoreductase [Cytobacillus purgationiresistens]MDQ0268823.1 FMN-dependent oxidoreductase (nitrilotriacetate monooxygenase family) [Cytobacillus purgationiresistens]
MGKQIQLNAFEMAGPMHNSHGLWKHPDSKRHLHYNDLNYWIDLAKLLEKGKFDAIFFADVAGVYDVYQKSKAPAIREGVQFPLNDPALIVSAMASVTTDLAFAVTVSTTYEHPFSNARRFSTLDHLTKGRVAWNIVTSYLPNAAKNYGLANMVKHDERYNRADEFLEVSYKLWEGSWEEGAVVADVDHHTLINPDKVHEINHSGKYYQVAGPHMTDPSLQRTPVIYQAGTSEKGRDFAAKHAECVFVGGPTNEKIRYYIQDIKNRAEGYGRNPDSIKAYTFLNVIVAQTTEEAEKKYEEYSRLWSSDAAKAQYGGSSGYDLDEYKDLDAYFEYKHTEHGQTRAASLTKDAPKKLTVREVLERFETIDRNHVIVGNPTEVADAIQFYFEDTGIDGFNLAHLVTPKSLEEFIDFVVPELQRRGIYKNEYDQGTFREKIFGPGRSLLSSDHPGAKFRHKHVQQI